MPTVTAGYGTNRRSTRSAARARNPAILTPGSRPPPVGVAISHSAAASGAGSADRMPSGYALMRRGFRSVGRRYDPPLEALGEVVEAPLADPMIAGAVLMRGGRGVALGEGVGVLGDCLPVRLREVGVHELRPAEFAVVVLPGIASRVVAAPCELGSMQIAFLVGEPPVGLLAGHRGSDTSLRPNGRPRRVAAGRVEAA